MLEGAGRGRAGVVDEDVDPAEPLEGRGHEPIEFRGARDVAVNVEDGRAVRPERLRGACEALGVAPADRHRRALGREPPGRGEAQSVGAASDDGDLVPQSEVHRVPLAVDTTAEKLDHSPARFVKAPAASAPTNAAGTRQMLAPPSCALTTPTLIIATR